MHRAFTGLTRMSSERQTFNAGPGFWLMAGFFAWFTSGIFHVYPFIVYVLMLMWGMILCVFPCWTVLTSDGFQRHGLIRIKRFSEGRPWPEAIRITIEESSWERPRIVLTFADHSQVEFGPRTITRWPEFCRLILSSLPEGRCPFFVGFSAA